MASHSSTLAWKIPWMEEPGELQSMGWLESDMTERLHFHFSVSCLVEGNGNLLQCSCLENPRDGGACWAATYGVAQSRTRLKWLSSSSSRAPGKKPFLSWIPSGQVSLWCCWGLSEGKLAESESSPGESGVRRCRHAASSYPRAPGPACQERPYHWDFYL